VKGVLRGLFDQRGRDGEQRREPVVVDVQHGEERQLLDRARLEPGGLERLPFRPRRDRVGARDAAGEVDGHPIGSRQRRGEILLEALDAGLAVSLKTQQRAPRRVAEAAGVVLADHQADDLGQIDVDVHQDVALDVEEHLRTDDPRAAAVEGDRVHHEAVLLAHQRLRVGIAVRLDQRRLPLDLVQESHRVASIMPGSRRWPTEVTPMLMRSSMVSFSSTSASISLSRNACTYRWRPKSLQPRRDVHAVILSQKAATPRRRLQFLCLDKSRTVSVSRSGAPSQLLTPR
jgi:hypothetical protein